MLLSKNDIITIRNRRQVNQTLKCHILPARHANLAIKTELGPSSNIAFEVSSDIDSDKNAVEQYVEFLDELVLTTKTGDIITQEQSKAWDSLMERAKAGLRWQNCFSSNSQQDVPVINRIALAIHESKNCPYSLACLKQIESSYSELNEEVLTEPNIFYMGIYLTEKAEKLGYGRGHLRSWGVNAKERALSAKEIIRKIVYSLGARSPVLVHCDETPEPTSPELIALYDELAKSISSITVLPTGEVEASKSADLIYIKVWKK